jgi:RNA polymerase sigma factor (sigma-70 family)
MSATTTISTSGSGLISRPSPMDAVPSERARRQQERSFETVYKRHHARLLSYCRHIMGNREEAEDALQQTFIKAHRAMSSGNPPRELRPWLYAVARNCCLSAIAARKPTSELDDRTASLAGLPEQVSQREDLRELVGGLGRLPEDQRSALLLAELEDLSHEEIASVLECPVSKVKALVYQARTSLIAERAARDTPCQEIREQLSVARGGVLRRGPLRRHLKLCSGCRDFQQVVSAQRQSLAAVLPVLPTAGLAASVLGHVATHAASHAAASGGIGGAGASLAPAGATGTAGVAASSGAGVAGGSIVGSGSIAGGGSMAGGSVLGGGSIVGGGLATKLAVSGAVAVLATAGAVTAGHRLVHQQRAPSRNSEQLLRHGHRGAVVPSPPVTDGLTTPVNYRADSLGESLGGGSTSLPGPTTAAIPQTSLSGVSSGAPLLMSSIPSSPSGTPSNGASPGSGTPASGPGSTGAPGGPVAGHASGAARRRAQSQLRRARQHRARLRAAVRRRRLLRAAARRRRLQAAARRRLHAAALRRREAARRRHEAALRRRLERIAGRKARAPKAKALARTPPAIVPVAPTLTKPAATPSPAKAPKAPAKPKKPKNPGAEARNSPEAETGSTAPAESGSSGVEVEEPAAGTGVEATNEESAPKPKAPGAKAKGPRAGRAKAPVKPTGAGTGVEAAATNAA